MPPSGAIARRLLPSAAFGAVLGAGVAAWPFTVDDAFVLARYARRIAGGAGYTMNAGPPTDGVTGPLALVPALIGEALFGDPVGASKAVGLLAAALAAALVVRRAAGEDVRNASARAASPAVRARVPPFGAATLTLLLAAGGATLGAWGAGGLETGLATLALTVAGLAVSARVAASERAGTSRRAGAWAGIAIFALAWLRPELALASAVLLVVLVRHDRRAGALALGLAALGLVSVVAFRLALFGAPLPLSAQAKPPELGNGAEYVLRGVVVALGGGGLVAAWLGAREGGAGERTLFAMLLAHLAALVLAGGDWMPGFRLFAPVLPLYALLAARPIAARWPDRRGRALALFAGCALIPLAGAAVQLPAARDAGATRERAGAELADWLAAHARRVALVDVGFLALRSGVEVVDLGGITDPRIGALPGGHLDKRIDPGLLRALAPDTIVLHAGAPPRLDAQGRLRLLAGYPVERRVARMPWVRAEMRVARVVEYTPRYFYVVLQRARRESRGGANGGTLAPWPPSSPLASSSPRPRCTSRASPGASWCWSSTGRTDPSASSSTAPRRSPSGR